jgi:hypothetical protein
MIKELGSAANAETVVLLSHKLKLVGSFHPRFLELQLMLAGNAGKSVSSWYNLTQELRKNKVRRDDSCGIGSE